MFIGLLFCFFVGTASSSSIPEGSYSYSSDVSEHEERTNRKSRATEQFFRWLVGCNEPASWPTYNKCKYATSLQLIAKQWGVEERGSKDSKGGG